jgi:hypothetical protein
MTDMREIRAKLRSSSNPQVQSSSGSVIIWSMGCVCAAAFAFAVVWYLLTPRVVPPQPSAAIPTFATVGSNGDSGISPPTDVTPSPAPAMRIDPAALAGKSASEIGKMADDACFRRAHARYPHWSKTPRLTTKRLDEFHIDDMNHFNELLHCLITEAPTRYCSSSERRMIATEINHYFLAIAFFNRLTDRLRNMPPDLVSEFNIARPDMPTMAPDRPVIAAIEAWLRDGYLTKADRDRLSANAAEEIRHRLARIEPPPSPCPAQPWWAFWR